MKIVASGVTGTIGKYLPERVVPLNQRLDEISENELNLSRGDTYIHLGAMVGPKVVSENRAASVQVNVESTIRLAEHGIKIGLEKFIFISTSHVYAEGLGDKSENSPIGPLNIYAQQKYDTEVQLMNLYEGNEDKLLILRVFSILDWDAKPFTLGGGINKLLTDPNSYLTCGDDVRDFLTPYQAASTIMDLTNRKTGHTILNICTGQGISIRKAAQLMLKTKIQGDWSEKIKHGNSDVPRLVGNPTNLRKVLGYPLKWSHLENK